MMLIPNWEKHSKVNKVAQRGSQVNKQKEGKQEKQKENQVKYEHKKEGVKEQKSYEGYKKENRQGDEEGREGQGRLVRREKKIRMKERNWTKGWRWRVKQLGI